MRSLCESPFDSITFNVFDIWQYPFCVHCVYSLIDLLTSLLPTFNFHFSSMFAGQAEAHSCIRRPSDSNPYERLLLEVPRRAGLPNREASGKNSVHHISRSARRVCHSRSLVAKAMRQPDRIFLINIDLSLQPHRDGGLHGWVLGITTPTKRFQV